MGNSQAVDQLTPEQQKALLSKYDKNNANLFKELNKLENKSKEDMVYIRKLKQDVAQQRLMLHPFNTSEYDETQTNNTQPAPQTNEWHHWRNWPDLNKTNQPVQPIQPVAGVVPPAQPTQPAQPAQPQGLLSGISSALGASNCQSTANGGVCAPTLTAPNGICKFNAQTDGNLVVYNKNNIPVWNSRTEKQGVPPYTLTMQPTGNLLWVDSNNTTVWQSNTTGQGVAPYRAHINEQCNFSILDSKNTSLWSTNTTGMGST
jgi:hypothetical protein